MPKNNMRLSTVSAVIGIVAVIGGLIAALGVMERPSLARARRADEQTINTLQSLRGNIGSYWQNNKQLPTQANLSLSTTLVVNKPTIPENLFISDPMVIEDLRNGAISYAALAITGPATSTSLYKLCAVFQTEASEPMPHNWSAVFSIHPKGNHCFILDARYF